jgi:uncharacterized protein YjdB
MDTIKATGMVLEPEARFSQKGEKVTKFTLAVYAGKIDNQYAPSFFIRVQTKENIILESKQKDVTVSGFMTAFKGQDGKVHHTLWANSVTTNVPNWGSNDDVPF